MRGCVRNLLVGLVVSNGLGCGPVVMLGDDGDGDTASDADDDATSNATNPAGTTLPPSGTATTPMSTTAMPTSTTAMPPDDDTTGPGVSFLDGFDTPTGIPECDLWQQDCPSGEKCMPWANDGSNSWNATRCTEVDDNPGQVGDECTVEGSGVTGIDSCDVASMCYYVDPKTNVGTCVGFCEGSPDNPMCDQGFLCSIANNGVLILCRRECDPLLQDCAGSAACLPAAGSDGFVCIVDASGEGGGPGDPCEFLNSCDPGLSCAFPEEVPGCATAGCCTEFCDLTDPDPDAACTQAGQMCVSWFEEGTAPPTLEHVGFCSLPT